jgi:hypothetical protein
MSAAEGSVLDPQLWVLIRSYISYTKAEAVDNTLRTIEEHFPLEHCEYSALCFPLFAAGCESDTPEQYEVVMSALKQLEQNFGIGNTRRLKSLLEHIWMSGDENGTRRHWDDVLKDLGWEMILT